MPNYHFRMENVDSKSILVEPHCISIYVPIWFFLLSNNLFISYLSKFHKVEACPRNLTYLEISLEIDYSFNT